MKLPRRFVVSCQCTAAVHVARTQRQLTTEVLRWTSTCQMKDVTSLVRTTLPLQLHHPALCSHSTRCTCSQALSGLQSNQNVTMPPQKELEDTVHRTCRFTAGLRALELMRNPDNPIIRDELAGHLAGEETLKRLNTLWDSSRAAKLCADGTELDLNKPQHSYFAGRARILDDRITAALQQLHEQTTSDIQTLPQAKDSSHSHIQQDSAAVSRPESDAGSKLQVVSLGCGLDSRPWRLDFPTGAAVAWFDVDQQPVLDLKAALLVEAAAEVPQHQQQPLQEQQVANSSAGRTAGAADQGCMDISVSKCSSSKPSVDIRFPLKCSSYTMLAVDVTNHKWIQELQSAGFEPKTPTVWVPEGLLYYLNPEDVMRLMLDIAAATADTPTVILASHIPLCNLEASRNAPEGYPLKNLLKSCVDDLDIQRLKYAGWSDIIISKDLAVILKEEYGAQVAYPNNLEYSRGKPLESTELLVHLSRGLKQPSLGQALMG